MLQCILGGSFGQPSPKDSPDIAPTLPQKCRFLQTLRGAPYRNMSFWGLCVEAAEIGKVFADFPAVACAFRNVGIQAVRSLVIGMKRSARLLESHALAPLASLVAGAVHFGVGSYRWGGGTSPEHVPWMLPDSEIPFAHLDLWLWIA